MGKEKEEEELNSRSFWEFLNVVSGSCDSSGQHCSEITWEPHFFLFFSCAIFHFFHCAPHHDREMLNRCSSNDELHSLFDEYPQAIYLTNHSLQSLPHSRYASGPPMARGSYCLYRSFSGRTNPNGF